MIEASQPNGGPLLGEGVLLGSYDVDPVMEDEHNRWCIHEHIPE